MPVRNTVDGGGFMSQLQVLSRPLSTTAATRFEWGGGGKALAACTVGLALGYSVVGMATFSVFVAPLQRAFGWGRGDISIAYSIMCYVMACVSPFAGIAFDRWGVRRVLLPAIVALGVVFASLSLLSGSLAWYYAVYALIAIVGAGTAPHGYMRTLALWFERNRGLAFGIALSGVGIGTAVIPVPVQFMNDRYGWRAGYLVVAALVLLVSLPVIWRMLREPAAVTRSADPSLAAASATGLMPAEAMRTRAFWQMIVAFPLLGIFTSGLLAHLVPLLRDHGMASELAASGLSMLGIALIFGRVLTGWLLDRLFAPRLVAGCIGLALVGVAILWAGATGITAFVAIALLGLAIGAELDFMSYLISRYQGLRAYARIYGLMYGAFIVGSGLGPLLMGFGHQALGSYDAALVGMMVVLAITLPLFLTLKRYPKFVAAEAGRN